MCIRLLHAYKCSAEAFFNHMTFMLVHMNTHLLVIHLSASDVFGQLMLWGPEEVVNDCLLFPFKRSWFTLFFGARTISCGKKTVFK